MPVFSSFDGLQLAYDDLAPEAGPTRDVPVVLHHGFAADAAGNWHLPGITAALLASGRRVLAIDARGHGRSAKPHDPAAYGDRAMSRDVRALLDHVGVTCVDLVGYSMGALVSLEIACEGDARLRSVVLGGIGGAVVSGGSVNRSGIAEAFESDDPQSSADPVARQFARFARSTGGDLRALAAVMRSEGNRSFGGIERIAVPVLVLVGVDDPLAQEPERLASAIPGAVHATVPGDHLGAVMKPQFPVEILAWLDEVDERA